MQFSEPGLATVLARLAAASGMSATELGPVFADLAADVRAAVPSYLGVTVTVDDTTGPATFTALDPVSPVDPPMVEASLDLTITHPGASARGPVTITLFAGAPAAFAALATELTTAGWVLAIEVAIDRHLGRLPAAGWPDLESAATIDRAIGVLVDRGHDPVAALAALRERAGPDAMMRTAQKVLGSLAVRPDTPDARAGPSG